jgi:hypothetical protein
MTTFANTINNLPIYAKRATRDRDGRGIVTKYICPETLTAAQILQLQKDLGIDETVLFSNSWTANTGTPISLSESPANFKWLDIYYGFGGNSSGGNCCAGSLRIPSNKYNGLVLFSLFTSTPTDASSNAYLAMQTINGSKTASWARTSYYYAGVHAYNQNFNTDSQYSRIHKIVGVHRIAGG